MKNKLILLILSVIFSSCANIKIVEYNPPKTAIGHQPSYYFQIKRNDTKRIKKLDK